MKVSELQGAELDYWVARAVGLKVEGVSNKPGMFVVHTEKNAVAYVSPGHGIWPSYEPSSDWMRGGPIIEQERISVYASMDEGRLLHWVGVVETVQSTRRGWVAPTPLIAAMRAVVASKFGDEVPSGADSQGGE